MKLNGGCVENVERALRAERSGKKEEQVAGAARCVDGDISCLLGTQRNRPVLEKEVLLPQDEE
jgi:hypothetical protein